MLLGDALDGVVNSVGDGLAHAFDRITRLSCATVAAEGSRELRGEKIDLPSDRIGALEIRPVNRFVELGAKIREPRAIFTSRALVDEVAQVGFAAHPLVCKIRLTRSAPHELGPSLVTECSELRHVSLLLWMNQQMLEVDEPLQAAHGDPGSLVSDAPEIALVPQDAAIA
jgi:hypothetical protein